jgi:hypothetical protein
MFENRTREKRRNAFLVLFGLLLVTAFGFGYYLNYGDSIDIGKENPEQGSKGGYQIPDNIKNPRIGSLNPEGQGGNNNHAQTEPDTPIASTEPDRPVIVMPNNLITANTKVIFKTYFTLCSHMVDQELLDTKELVNMSESKLAARYPDWSVREFSPQQVILKREIQTYCPRHFIIGSKDGYVAIYVYDSEGVKTLFEMTNNPISVLTPDDQRNLEYGIVADSEEELQQTLEGLGD